jgi:putative oxidoreductase
MNRLPLAKIALWLLIGLTAVAFATAGFLKLFGEEMYSDPFNVMGLPDVFGDVIGCCEIAGAIGLFIRRLSAIAATGLASLMVGAVGYHLHYESLAEAVPAVILLSFSVIIVFARRCDNILYRTDSTDAA